MAHIARRFEALLDAYRRADGRRWSGQNLSDATGGIVTRSYVTNLRKGRIENPRYEKLNAIAKVIGFSPELWFDGSFAPPVRAIAKSAAEKPDIAGKVNHLFEVIRHEKTGEPDTNAEVARRSLGGLTGQDGGLTEEEIRKLRTGEIPNPSVNQVVALADFFGVQPSYFVDSKQEPLLLDEEAISSLEDDTTSAILHKSIRLSRREGHDPGHHPTIRELATPGRCISYLREALAREALTNLEPGTTAGCVWEIVSWRAPSF